MLITRANVELAHFCLCNALLRRYCRGLGLSTAAVKEVSDERRRGASVRGFKLHFWVREGSVILATKFNNIAKTDKYVLLNLYEGKLYNTF